MPNLTALTLSGERVVLSSFGFIARMCPALRCFCDEQSAVTDWSPPPSPRALSIEHLELNPERGAIGIGTAVLINWLRVCPWLSFVLLPKDTDLVALADGIEDKNIKLPRLNQIVWNRRGDAELEWKHKLHVATVLSHVCAQFEGLLAEVASEVPQHKPNPTSTPEDRREHFKFGSRYRTSDAR